MNRALFCLDIQIDHFPMGMLEVKDTDSLIGELNTYRKAFDKVFLFNSSYPADHIRFAANHMWRKPGASIEIDGNEINLFPMYCIQDSWGAEIHPTFNKKESDQIISRGQNKAVNPSLLWEDPTFIDDLKNKDIKEIIISGIVIEESLLQNSINKLISEGFVVDLKQELIRKELLPYA